MFAGRSPLDSALLALAEGHLVYLPPRGAAVTHHARCIKRMQDINAPRVIFCFPHGLDGGADSSVDYSLDLRIVDLLGLRVGL